VGEAGVWAIGWGVFVVAGGWVGWWWCGGGGLGVRLVWCLVVCVCGCIGAVVVGVFWFLVEIVGGWWGGHGGGGVDRGFSTRWFGVVVGGGRGGGGVWWVRYGRGALRCVGLGERWEG